MIKNKSEEAIRNATWDTALLQSWIKRIKDDEGRKTWLLATQDKAIRETARLIFIKDDEQSDNEKYYERIKEQLTNYWGRKNQFGAEIIERFRSMGNKDEDHLAFTSSEYHKNIRIDVAKEYSDIFESGY